MMLVPARKIFFAGVAFTAIFLIFIHSSPAPYKLPVSSAGAVENEEAPVIVDPDPENAEPDPVNVEPEDDRFHWSKASQRYPVESLIPLPTTVAQIPRIQHDFPPESEEARKVRLSRLEEIKAEFMHAWKGYKEHAWLKDEVAPLSGGARDTFGGWAATLVDSLDTLWIMDLKLDFAAAVDAVSTLDFTRCTSAELNVFETTIRHLGGLLAAHDLSGGAYPALLAKAAELGGLLLLAFDTPNRLPLTRWPFPRSMREYAARAQEASDGAPSAEVGSLTLEFTRLAQLTGDARFYDAGAARVARAFAAQQNATRVPGLWPVAVDARAGDFTRWGFFTIGGMADSLYEYLPKEFALLGGGGDEGEAAALYRDMFVGAAEAMRERLFYRPVTKGGEDVLVAGDVVAEDGGPRLDPRNQHLTCFAGGMFGIAGRMFGREDDVEVGRKLTEGCLWAYETSPNGIMPEIMHTLPCEDAKNCVWDEQKWLDAVEKAYSEGDNSVDARAVIEENHLREGIVKVGDARYILRPEAIESIFILYRITGDETLRERAWKMFQKIIQFTKTEIAHAGLDDCVTDDPPKSDRMESFWMAETLKYFFLLFSEPDVVSLDDYVLNTEAHPFKRPA